MGISFADGFASSIDVVSTAVANTAGQVKGLVRGQLEGSPRLFTYYLGQELVSDLAEGMARPVARIMRPVISPELIGLDRLERALTRDGEGERNRFRRDTRGEVKLDGYLVGRAQRMSRLRAADRV